jgi:hypothetical protein
MLCIPKKIVFSPDEWVIPVLYMAPSVQHVIQYVDLKPLRSGAWFRQCQTNHLSLAESSFQIA